MTPAELQQVRAMPLFAGLADSQLGCLDGGEIIEVPPGTVLVSEGERNAVFYLLLEGEIRITRTYDRQSILMRVNKAGRLPRRNRAVNGYSLASDSPRH